ncbi:MAG: tRNA pseudouridine(38-40) synthase TruA [Synergistaceae bacterium]|jgi:tRNA pseudouridine38-40 synthase|nr:tRNA pseudouridine(38-40) synthase TruA [Synergistaceae bacterium]
MPRIALELSYDGTGFSGWQSQSNENGVQDAVEGALRALGERVRINGAGRTDAGVHARAQIAHFDAVHAWAPRRLRLAINARLPASVSVMRAATTDDSFDARRDAVYREYRYFIWNAPTCYPHIKPYVLWLCGSHFDWGRAAQAASLLAGEHDFGAFCRTSDRPANTIRTVKSAALKRRGSMIVFRIIANSYLTNMVRITVGNLLAVAAGKRDDAWFESLLYGARRHISAKTVAPCGLFLWRVVYSEDIFKSPLPV